MIQGYSAFMQFLSGEIRNKIDDLRNELEKAYGSLYSILVNKRTNGKDNQIEVDPDEAKCLEHIMTTCPFMFPKDIQDIWQTDVRSTIRFFKNSVDFITVEFQERAIEEYDRKIKEYNELVGKG